MTITAAFIEEVRALRLLKMSYSQIAEKLQCTKDRVESALRKGGAVKKRLSLAQRDLLIQRRMNGALLRELCAEFNVSEPVVIDICRDLDLSHLESYKDAVVADYLAGVSYEEMSKQHGLGVKALCGIVYRSGVPSRKRMLTDEEVESLIKERVAGVSIRFLAEKYELSEGGVKSVCSRNEITIPMEQRNANAQVEKTKSFLESRGVANHDELLAQYALKHKGKSLSPYVKNNIKTKWQCAKGHEFEMIPNAVQQGQWCPRCSHVGPSRGQIEVYEYVKSLGFEVELGNRSEIVNPETNRNLELDVYIPSKKFGIEYNGLMFHSELYQKDKNRHKKKAAACRDAGIRLLAMFEDEWDDESVNGKRELLKGMIRHRLGVFGKKLRASKLELIRMVKNSDFKDFFKRNHLDGHSNAKHAYGLKHEGKLVACLSIRVNHQAEVEICRFATDYDFHIHGAGGKLIKAALEEHKSLITFSNNRLSDGDVYRKLGAKLLQENAPSYWYTDFKERQWRFKFKRINDPVFLAQFPEVAHNERDQAEAGLMSLKIWGDRRPCYKIYDFSHFKWLISLDNLTRTKNEAL